MNEVTWTDDSVEELGSYDGIPEGPPPPPKDGIYALRVVKAVRGLTTKAPPRPKAELEIKVLHAYGDETPSRAKTFHTVVFSKETMSMIRDIARASGIEPPTGKPTVEVVDAFCTELLQAGTIWGKIKQEPDNKGVQRARIKFFLREEQIQSALNGTLGQETTAEAPQVARRRR